MPYPIIDGHEDLAYNAITFGRDYLRSAMDTRAAEKYSAVPERGGECMLGWPDWQNAHVAVIFCTLFAMPKRYQGGDWEKVAYGTLDEAHVVYQKQLDYYQRLAGDNPLKFRILHEKSQFQKLWQGWHSDSEAINPIGLLLLMEGSEGIQAASEMEDWYERGVHIAGPAWAGNRFCGGTYEPGRFTSEGRLLLEIMADLGMGLDIAHMTEESAVEALDCFEGPVLASHVTARSLMKGKLGERLLTDTTICQVAEHDGVIGIMPYNKFLDPEWTKTSQRDKVSLQHYIDHIDHVCQLTGSSQYVAIGTDFDGTIGYPEVPLELTTIADLQKLEPNLIERGYKQVDIERIFGLNWARIIERVLPA